MTTRKNRPVLYEVAKFGKRPTPLTPPPAPQTTTPPAVETKTTERPAPQVAAPSAAPPQAPPRPAPVEPPPSAKASRPASTLFVPDQVSTEAEESAAPPAAGAHVPLRTREVTFTLSVPALAIGAAGLLLAFYVVFQAGRTLETGRSTTEQTAPAMTEPRAAEPPPATRVERTQTPPAAVPETAAPKSTSPAATPAAVSSGEREAAPSVELRAGYRYLVVQHFRKSSREAAEHAAAFLASKGLKVGLLGGADLRLIVDEPLLLDQDDKRGRAAEQQRADQLIARLRALGKEYYVQMGTYDFAGCYLHKAQ